jgi:fructose-bisphosphate aldolase, class I
MAPSLDGRPDDERASTHESEGLTVKGSTGAGAGKLVRLNRLFAHPTGFCSVAVDHFIGYGDAMPAGLRDVAAAVKGLVAGGPDAITMHKGPAAHIWPDYAASVPLIIQSSLVRVDDVALEQVATARDAIRLGADAIAVVAFVRGPSEARYLRNVAQVVSDAARFDLPVICHVYPRVFADGPAISFAPEDVAWAVRCVYEMGVDIVKVPYCGDVEAYRQVVAECPVPVVAAGGPKAETLLAALQLIDGVMAAGARGATIGRNIWGYPPIPETLAAFKAVIHDRATPEAAAALVPAKG